MKIGKREILITLINYADFLMWNFRENIYSFKK